MTLPAEQLREVPAPEGVVIARVLAEGGDVRALLATAAEAFGDGPPTDAPGRRLWRARAPGARRRRAGRRRLPQLDRRRRQRARRHRRARALPPPRDRSRADRGVGGRRGGRRSAAVLPHARGRRRRARLRPRRVRPRGHHDGAHGRLSPAARARPSRRHRPLCENGRHHDRCHPAARRAPDPRSWRPSGGSTRARSSRFARRLPSHHQGAYNTVQTVLNRLAERGLLTRRREAHVHRLRAVAHRGRVPLALDGAHAPRRVVRGTSGGPSRSSSAACRATRLPSWAGWQTKSRWSGCDDRRGARRRGCVRRDRPSASPRACSARTRPPPASCGPLRSACAPSSSWALWPARSCCCTPATCCAPSPNGLAPRTTRSPDMPSRRWAGWR